MSDKETSLARTYNRPGLTVGEYSSRRARTTQEVPREVDSRRRNRLRNIYSIERGDTPDQSTLHEFLCYKR